MFVTAETIVLLVGLFRLLPDRRGLLVIPFLALLFNALEEFGTTFELLPYYAGAIQHDRGGEVSTLKISQLAHGGASRIFENLLANKPAFLTAPELRILMAVSFVAAVALVSIACVIAVSPPVAAGRLVRS